jgi:hypothetical protein
VSYVLPARHDGQSWTTRYVCERCRCEYFHLEVSPDPDDEPDGLPFELRWCECGGFLLARSPDYDSRHG